MPIDTASTMVIAGSRSKLAGLVMIGLLLTGLGAALAFPNSSGMITGPFGQIAGYAALAFFSPCTVIALRRLATAGGAIVTLSPEGLRDTRVAAGVVPWKAVHRLSTWELSGQKVMVVAVDPALERTLTLTLLARLSRGPNRALGADGLCISASGLNITHDQLLRACSAYAAAAHAAAST